jgi:predicted transcriptional regulator
MGEPQRVATFKLPDSDYRLLEQLAERTDRSVSAVIRLAIRAYLEHHQQQQEEPS